MVRGPGLISLVPHAISREPDFSQKNLGNFPFRASRNILFPVPTQYWHLGECFPTLNKTGKQPVPNAGTELGPGRGCSQMLGTENFPFFLGNIRFPRNCIWERRPLQYLNFIIHNVFFFNKDNDTV